MDDLFLIVESGERCDPKAKNLLNGPTVSPTGVENMNMVVKAQTEVQTWFLPFACSSVPVCPAEHELYSYVRGRKMLKQFLSQLSGTKLFIAVFSLNSLPFVRAGF